MKNEDKEQLIKTPYLTGIDEPAKLRQRIAELEKSESECKRAEEALHEAEAKYRTIFENAVEGIFLIALDGRILAANPAAARMMGYDSPEEFITVVTDIRQIYLDPDHRDELIHLVQTKGVVIGFEVQTRRKDGSVIWTSANVRALRDENGSVVGFVGMGVDITERKRIEEALHESEKQYRSLFEDSPISLWVEDFSDVKVYIDRLHDSGVNDFRTYFENHPKDVINCARMVKVVDVNKATMNLYGAKSKEEFQGGLNRVFNEESYDVFREELIVFAEGKIRFESEAANLTLTGEKKDIALGWSLAPPYESGLSKILVSIIDITERKRIEEALRKERDKAQKYLDIAGVMIVVIDADQKVTLVNKKCSEILGYEDQKIIGKNWFDTFIPERIRNEIKSGSCMPIIE